MPHQNRAMRLRIRFGIALLSWGIGLSAAAAQSDYRHTTPTPQVQNTTSHYEGGLADSTLDADDRLSLIAAALDSRAHYSARDCSHLVHAIYDEAGFSYGYAPSSEIYSGIEGFQRVKRPEPGDLVVWRGHVGIVIKPSQHMFFSYLRSGAGIDDYDAPYWKHRGHPRFYRYLKNSPCAECERSRANRLVKIKK